MLTTMTGDFITVHRTAVASIAAVVMHRIGIEDFTPFARLVNTEAIAMAGHRRKVTDHDDFIANLVTTHESQHRTFVVIHHQPLKAIGVKVELVQCFVMTIGEVQIAHQTLYAVMPVITAFQQVPVEAGVMVPFTSLRKLVAHKQQFLTGKAHIQP